MVDEALDETTHDMVFTNYDGATVTGADQVRQNCKIRLLMIKGEYFGNSNLGNIDFNALANKTNIPAMIDAANKATIKATPEVLSLLSYTSNFDTSKRTLTISFSAQTIYGPITINNLVVAI